MLGFRKSGHICALEVPLLNIKTSYTTRFLSVRLYDQLVQDMYMGPVLSHNTGDCYLHADLLF